MRYPTSNQHFALRMLSYLGLACLLTLTAEPILFAQKEHYTTDRVLAEEIGLIKKRQDKFNLFLNLHMSGTGELINGIPHAAFSVRELRLEAKGNINKWLSYAWRQRLNKPNNSTETIDKLPHSVDIARIGVSPIPSVTLFFGKLCAAFGGIEYDLNPINVHEYSYMGSHLPGYLTGIGVEYTPIKEQQFQFQILNARTKSYQETYPLIDQGKYPEVHLPFLYAMNWNGTINKHWKSRYSYSLMTQSKDKHLHYIALGNLFSMGKFTAYLDAMYSYEGLNSRSSFANSPFDVQYLSFVVSAEYKISDHWNIVGKTTSDAALSKGPWHHLISNPSHYSYAYMVGTEYAPMKESNFHFFLLYIGRADQNFENPALTAYTNRITTGIIYQLPMF